jgi:hypothetical protein
LERIRRLLGRQPLGEHGLRVRTGAAGDGLVLERDGGMVLVPDGDELLEAVGLASARPPGEHCELLGLLAGVRLALRETRTRQHDQDGCSQD